MKKIKFPTPYTVLVIVMIFAATLTWLLPSGGYDTLWYDKGKDVFVIQSVDKTHEVPATQEALTSRNISITLDKFKSRRSRTRSLFLIPTKSVKQLHKGSQRYSLHLSKEYMKR